MAWRVLDLGGGAGGAGLGYHRAGFEVVGVDIAPQPRYPFTFIQADMLTFPLEGFDLVHLSAPCQRWSRQGSCRPALRAQYPDLITPMRPRLQASRIPYIMENVPGAPLLRPLMLCGAMFGRELYRHRLFEASFPLTAPAHPRHAKRASRAGHWEPGTVISVAGHCSPIALAREVMDIGWMRRAELAESVPPYFTEYVGRQAMALLAQAA